MVYIKSAHDLLDHRQVIEPYFTHKPITARKLLTLLTDLWHQSQARYRLLSLYQVFCPRYFLFLY